MWSINSKIWFSIFTVWLLVILSLYLKSDITMENINSLLNILAGILVTASVGMGAIAYIFVKSGTMTRVLDMVIVLIFLSFTSAVIAHIDDIGFLFLKKVQVFLNALVLTTSCAYIGGYLVGLIGEGKETNKRNVNNVTPDKKKMNKRKGKTNIVK